MNLGRAFLPVPAALLLGVSLGCGGGIPATVRRVDAPAATEVRGIRYVLKNPTYSASLLFKGSAEGADQFDLFFEQRLEKESVYEIRPEGSWRSETEVSVTVEADARLSAFTGGATDKLSDIVVNVASLAVKVAPGIKALGVTPFDTYLNEHKNLMEDRKKLAETLRELRAGIPGQKDPAALKGRLDAATALEADLAKLDEKIKAHRFKVPEGMLAVEIDGKAVLAAQKPLVKVSLSRVR